MDADRGVRRKEPRVKSFASFLALCGLVAIVMRYSSNRWVDVLPRWIWYRRMENLPSATTTGSTPRSCTAISPGDNRNAPITKPATEIVCCPTYNKPRSSATCDETAFSPFFRVQSNRARREGRRFGPDAFRTGINRVPFFGVSSPRRCLRRPLALCPPGGMFRVKVAP